MRDAVVRDAHAPRPILQRDRHERGWPRFALQQQTGASYQSFRLFVRAMGKVDNHDARGADWEIIQWRALGPS